jgi:hypothetical protein
VDKVKITKFSRHQRYYRKQKARKEGVVIKRVDTLTPVGEIDTGMNYVGMVHSLDEAVSK